MDRPAAHTRQVRWIGLWALLVSGVAAIASPAEAQTAAGASRRPNVILIYTDDQAWDEVGCYGGQVATPHMDSLARDGVRFTRFYVASPVCTPSRYNVISGRYASRSRRQQASFPPGGPINIGWEAGVVGEPLFAQALQAAGYTTGMVGKWHIGLSEEPVDLPIDADPNDPQVKQALRANYDRVIRSIQKCGFDSVASAYGLNPGSGKKPPPKFWLPKVLQQHNMEWVTQGALEFIDRSKDRPFFLYVAPTLPHAPPATESLKSDPRISALGYLDRPPDVRPSRQEMLARVAGMEPRQAAAAWLDANLGAILEKLDALGLADRTAIFLASDNGRTGKFTCYDGGARTLLLARWKGGFASGRVCDKLASNIDLVPTVLELCGVRPPADLPLDGKSLLPLLKGGGEPVHRSLLLEITTERAVVTDEGFKYIAVRYPSDIQKQVDQGVRYDHWCRRIGQDSNTMGADREYPNYFDQDQLYDLNADPRERRNLAGDPQYRPRLESLKQLLREYSARLPHRFGEFTAPPGSR